MTKLRVTLIVMGCLALLVGVMAPAAGQPGPLKGNVFLEGEGPLAGVEVFVFDPEQGALFTCTDKNGAFEFENVSDSEGLIAAVGVGQKGLCVNWMFRAPNGDKLLNEYYNGHSGVKIFDPFKRSDGPIDFVVERAGNRPSCLGLLHTLEQQPTDGPDKLVGTPGNDVIAGLAGNDDIRGKGGDDILCGDEGKDELHPGTGEDIVDGGPGKDWSIYSSAKKKVTVKLKKGSAIGQGRDILLRIENVVGSDFADRLFGDSKDNRFKGGDGKDTIEGKGGDDTMYGNRKADTLRGGSGKDVANGGPGKDTCSAETKISCP